MEDTICALSTAPGRGGIAVVRVSGRESFALVERIFVPAQPSRPAEPRRAVLGRIVDPASQAEIDQALVTRFRAPRSYTGEDVVEISLHGSPVLVSAVLEALCSLGARPAEPGEFTMRGFLLGRTDLAQAEAVRDIIEAQTLYQAQVAQRQREGELSRRLQPVKDKLIEVIIQLESAVEFVEDELELESGEALGGRLREIEGEISDWLATYRIGRVIREGFSLAVIGRPNAGKSSLFNALLARERSIVTATPGTTRDLVSETASVEGIPVRLVDTAGMRVPGDEIERMGVERSLGAAADADAVLLVVDRSRARCTEDLELRRRIDGFSCIVAMNKADLPALWNSGEQSDYAAGLPWLEVSAKTGYGVDQLRKEIFRGFFGDGALEQQGVLVTNARHRRCLDAARIHIDAAGRAFDSGLSEEFVLADLHRALGSLGEITGETGVEDLLDGIFSRFCIGK